MSTRHDILYLSHGGGPLPLLGDEGHADLVDSLRSIADRIPRPDAILVISAHWEEATPGVTAGASPGMIYDYYGFPPETYQIQYPAPGHPELSRRVAKTLQAQGIPAVLDEQRGYDHGLYVPLMLMYSDADIPCVQLSLLESLDAEQHLRLGEAVRGLDHDNLLVIGSGMSFHNLRALRQPDSDAVRDQNLGFEEWLISTCSDDGITEADRRAALIDWQSAPAARFCHPREEHLLPLHVCVGMAGRACDEVMRVPVMGRMTSMYFWSRDAA